MEYCEKSTLRDTIDHGLHQDQNRLWRLFREILDGLAYIHQQVFINVFEFPLSLKANEVTEVFHKSMEPMISYFKDYFN